MRGGGQKGRTQFGAQPNKAGWGKHPGGDCRSVCVDARRGFEKMNPGAAPEPGPLESVESRNYRVGYARQTQKL